jgi:superfamily II DNA or RNA helicase
MLTNINVPKLDSVTTVVIVLQTMCPRCTCAQVLVSTPAAYMHLDHSKLGPDKFSIIVFDEAHHVIKKVSLQQSCSTH